MSKHISYLPRKCSSQFKRDFCRILKIYLDIDDCAGLNLRKFQTRNKTFCFHLIRRTIDGMNFEQKSDLRIIVERRARVPHFQNLRLRRFARCKQLVCLMPPKTRRKTIIIGTIVTTVINNTPATIMIMNIFVLMPKSGMS